ncbi:hypothetical protein INT45_007543 [Circinella minor]|uniref:Uncharacterized protein n=1 Tax=Circinella minor TaxID=1195481 RepID=A0A8H7S398_9FUNG|nr:hypothetical protein INT45_007543 [Circinella minor]
MTWIPFCCPDISSYVDFSANPMVTDVTFGCFQDGFYLCTTTMFFQELGKNFGIYDFVNTNGTSNFSGMVVEFLAAQRAGFIAAFEESFPLARVSKNGAVVNHERRKEFIDYTHFLYTATTMAVFQNTANMILREFPRVKN